MKSPRFEKGMQRRPEIARFKWSAVRRFLALLALTAATQALAQSESTPVQLTGTLAKIRQSGTVTIAHRTSSIPFSYLSPRGEPIGYSIDLCKLLVDAIGEEVGRALNIKWQPVTSETRIASITSGQSDLECGSTTSNLERRKLVSFSPIIFVSGTKLLVKKGSPIRSYRDLGGKKIAVTAGTTNEQAMQEVARRFKLAFDLRQAPDHAASFALLTGGEVDAFATDDVLLYGLLAQNKKQGEYVVVGEFLSYDPYGIMFRKDDAQFARVIQDAFHALAADGEIERRHKRWFLRKLPTGESLDLPMSPQLEEIIKSMAAGTE
jgi:glutamate/aspartate transport system substrate-binding protein